MCSIICPYMRIKPESIILSKPVIFFTLLFWFLLCFQIQNLHAENIGSVVNLIGDHDAVLVADHQGRIIVSKNADKKLIPASTLKILTSLVAIHYLGQDYRFTTEFYLDNDSNPKKRRASLLKSIMDDPVVLNSQDVASPVDLIRKDRQR